MNRTFQAPVSWFSAGSKPVSSKICFTTWLSKFQIYKTAFMTDPWLHRDKQPLKNHLVSL